MCKYMKVMKVMKAKKEIIIERFASVNGIGPNLAKRLYDAGARRISQLLAYPKFRCMLSNPTQVELKYKPVKEIPTKTANEIIKYLEKNLYIVNIFESCSMHTHRSYEKTNLPIGKEENHYLIADLSDTEVPNYVDADKNIRKSMRAFRKKHKDEKFIPVGSVARYWENTIHHDVDILTTIPVRKISFMSKTFPSDDKESKKKNIRVVATLLNGNTHKITILKYKGHNYRVDFFYAPKESFLFSKFQLTATKEYNIILRRWAKLHGFKLSQHGLWKGNKKIECTNEADIYKALGKPFKPLKDRNGKE
jgi:DNA polymerase/3'-5' exonuclease PolX